MFYHYKSIKLRNVAVRYLYIEQYKYLVKKFALSLIKHITNIKNDISDKKYL